MVAPPRLDQVAASRSADQRILEIVGQRGGEFEHAALELGSQQVEVDVGPAEMCLSHGSTNTRRIGRRRVRY